MPSSPTNREDGIWVRFDENGNLRFRIIQRIQSTKISHDRQHSRHYYEKRLENSPFSSRINQAV